MTESHGRELGRAGRSVTVWAALIGLCSALVTVVVADLVALVVAPASSPLFAVGSLVIDLVPPWVKDAAIALFGTRDKVALLLVLTVLVLGLAVLVGVLEFRRPPWGVVVLVLVAGIATVAVTTREGASALWALPTVLGMVAGVAVLRLAVARLRAWSPSVGEGAVAVAPDSRSAAVSRRRFLGFLGATSVSALLVGVVARSVNAARIAADTVRSAITLPSPVSAAPPVPPGAELSVEGITPLVTSNADFYRIDTALQVPAVDSETWRLRITGAVENEIEISFDELLALPLEESMTTLLCVSNEVGGDLVGNAVWLGYPIRDLLARAVPLPGADMVLSRSVDGFTAGTPLDVLLEEDRNSILAVGMNGEPLPIEHGFPVRMVVPGLYGYVSATKWLAELRVTSFSEESAYWTDRGWSERGPVKTQSRIDVPRDRSTVSAGTVAVAGVAWATHTGVDAVELRVDGGPWRQARLASSVSTDTWVQWVYEWEASAGEHTIEVRATDASGFTQGGARVAVIPDGAEGWHSVDVSVS